MQKQSTDKQTDDKANWSSRSIGSNWQHQFFYLTIKLGGRSLAYLALYFVVGYYVLCSRLARERASHYLQRRFPHATGVRKLWHCYRLILAFGKVLVDRAVVGIMGPESFQVSLAGREELLKLRDENNGMILMAAHVGCWQVAMSALDFLERPVHMLMRREDGDIDRHYYEHAGALRDMVQNHLMQLLCHTAMEPPVRLEPEELRNRKADVLNAVRRPKHDEVNQYAVRGQYGPGWLGGKQVVGYRQEADVAENSSVETFAALKLFVDNWRWQGVPFYLRTGKRLRDTLSMVAIQFRPVPHQSFPSEAIEDWQPNRLQIDIQPDEGISLRFLAKQPGVTLRLSPKDMNFRYAEAFKTEPPEAYETLLLDVIQGDATLFMRADQVECAWNVVDPVLEIWNSVDASDFPNYPSGSWGPESAEALIAQDGRSWL